MPNYEILLHPGKDSGTPRFWVVCIAIGDKHKLEWETVAMPSVRAYCVKHDLGFIAFFDALDKSDQPKHPSWQKFLIGEQLISEIDHLAEGVLVMDTDIVVNHHLAPSIFDAWDHKNVGLVSKRFRMPYDYMEVVKRVCFLRHYFVDEDYPLDSTFLFTLEQTYGAEGLETQEDEGCGGVFVFNPQLHSTLFSDAYFECKDLGETLALEQTHLNYYVQSAGIAQFLDYRFQTIWPFEIAWRYPFLYQQQFRENEQLICECVGASLATCYFLHFAGRWNESAMIKPALSYLDNGYGGKLGSLGKYIASDVKGVARGMIAPKKQKTKVSTGG